MTKESAESINLKISDYYGYENQKGQLVEELAELIQAVNKYDRARGIGQPLRSGNQHTAFDNLVEEIADVETMLERIKHLLNISEVEIHLIKEQKYKIGLQNIGGKNENN